MAAKYRIAAVRRRPPPRRDGGLSPFAAVRRRSPPRREPPGAAARPVAMQPRRHAHGLVLAGCLAAVAVLAGACAQAASTPVAVSSPVVVASPAPIASPTPEPAGTLLTVGTRGGLCADGPCGSTIVVERDGRIREAAKPPNEIGLVSAAALAALEDAIAKTDFAELKSHPFTGTCPVAFDGQEIVYEFAAPDGVERIASCEVEIDAASPLFRAVSAALGPRVPFPVP
jgi:hypothetical protein